MSKKLTTPDGKKVRLYPPPPKDFDPIAATEKDLMKHGLPLRPDSRTAPEAAALWEQQAARFRNFEHLEPELDLATAGDKPPVAANFGPTSQESCAYELTSFSAPITSLFVTWTVPNLQYSPSPFGVNHFRTFVGLGFLDVHVEMTVNSSNVVTSQIWAQGIGNVNLPVHPGDVISGSLCLNTNPAGTASYFLTNQTTSQAISFAVDTGFPPAVIINAGVTRSSVPPQPNPPLASFGIVYFDEISAFAVNGSKSLTSGTAVTMVNPSGKTLARAVRISDFAFKTVFDAAA